MSELFVPGARVAISDRWDDGVTEGFVEKVYKNGNFTLRGSKQQWRSWGGRTAMATGDSGYNRRRLEIWDAEADEEITRKLQEARLRKRWNVLRRKLDDVRNPTSDFCDALDIALNTLESTQPKG